MIEQGGDLLGHYKRTCALPDPEGVLQRNPQKTLVEQRTTGPQMPHSTSGSDIRPDPELAGPIEIDPDLALPTQEANALAPWNPEDAADESRESESFDPW
jgi:hypothetical protein